MLSTPLRRSVRLATTLRSEPSPKPSPTLRRSARLAEKKRATSDLNHVIESIAIEPTIESAIAPVAIKCIPFHCCGSHIKIADAIVTLQYLASILDSLDNNIGLAKCNLYLRDITGRNNFQNAKDILKSIQLPISIFESIENYILADCNKRLQAIYGEMIAIDNAIDLIYQKQQKCIRYTCVLVRSLIATLELL
jgi:hypothetical protein